MDLFKKVSLIFVSVLVMVSFFFLMSIEGLKLFYIGYYFMLSILSNTKLLYTVQYFLVCVKSKHACTLLLCKLELTSVQWKFIQYFSQIIIS